MLKKLGVATLAMAAALTCAVPSYAATLTVPITSITDFKNPGFPGGFQYTGNGSPSNGSGVLKFGSFAQSGISPLISTATSSVPLSGMFSFDYAVTGNSQVKVFFDIFDSSKTLLNTGSASILTAGTGAADTFTYNFTSFLSSAQASVSGEYFSIRIVNTGSVNGAVPAVSFGPVTIDIAVPEPVEAPALCMLLVAGGALVLRLRNKAVTAEEADLN